MKNTIDNGKILVEAFQEVLQWHDGIKGIKDDLARLYMDFNDIASANDDNGNRLADHFFLLHNMYLMFEHLEKYSTIDNK